MSYQSIVYLYCDGACRGNPGPGGWGVLMRYNEHEKRLCGGERATTNNRMELTAAIKGLKAIRADIPRHILITTDSQYVRRGVLEWLPQWKAREWKTSNNKPVKNKDLWELLDFLVRQHEVEWSWVKGHSGHPENEIADQLANQGIDQLS